MAMTVLTIPAAAETPAMKGLLCVMPSEAFYELVADAELIEDAGLVDDVDLVEAVGIDQLAGVALVVAALDANACVVLLAAADCLWLEAEADDIVGFVMVAAAELVGIGIESVLVWMRSATPTIVCAMPTLREKVPLPLLQSHVPAAAFGSQHHFSSPQDLEAHT